jgi:hypothetical protein
MGREKRWMREGDLIKRTYKMRVKILRTGQRKRTGKCKGKKWIGIRADK